MYIHMYIHMYVYMYVYITYTGDLYYYAIIITLVDLRAEGLRLATKHNYRKEPVRFDSFRFRTFREFIGSVRFGSENAMSRFDLRFPDASWLGPVRFGSFPRPVPAGSEIEWFGSAGSVRPVRFGFLFPPDKYIQ